MMKMMDFKPLTEDELEELDQLILEYATEESDKGIYSLVELDGFLTAILSSPTLIQPSQWLPRLWDYQEPQWKNKKVFGRYIDLIFRYYNELIDRLNRGIAGFSLDRMARDIVDKFVTYDLDPDPPKTRRFHRLPLPQCPYIHPG